jgi:hypothetical protein
MEESLDLGQLRGWSDAHCALLESETRALEARLGVGTRACLGQRVVASCMRLCAVYHLVVDFDYTTTL